ncbi:MAG: DUF1840 domain-containing protein [Rhodocyclaceae bacterium]|nr:DUF1840 domain-containing protein [Rhodocyclaceae bacterium]
MNGGLVTFKSQAAADVIYFADVAERLLELIGKVPAKQGIVTVEQLPEAIARLEAAIAADREAHRRQLLEEEPATEPDGHGGARPRVSLTQRALPLVEMFKISLAEKKPVVWGV